MRESTPAHWQKFWEEADTLELDDVYGTDGRMVREVMRLGDPTGKRIMEVGAGTGRDAVTLAKAGAEVLTLDYVAGSLEITRKAANAAGVEITTVCGDALGSPFPDGSFDVVFHQGLLEHFRDTTPLLRDNARLLKPGGHVIVDVPQTFHYYTVGKKILIAMDKWFAGWETQFTPAQLEGLVEAEGLEVTRTYGDWMVPGLWYRAVRKILMTRLGWKLPMMPFWTGWGEGWRRWFATKRLSIYTTPTIGVVARKPQREAAS